MKSFGELPISDGDDISRRIAGLKAAESGELFAHRFTLDAVERRVLITREEQLDLTGVTRQNASDGSVKIGYEGILPPAACKAAYIALEAEKNEGTLKIEL